MNKKNYERVKCPGYGKKRKFPCIIDDDGVAFFLPGRKHILIMRGKRYTYPAPSSSWIEVKCGDIIFELSLFRKAKAFEVYKICDDHFIAVRKPINV